MWRFVFIAALIIHGAAHFSGFVASWTSRAGGFSRNPWIFSDTLELNRGVGRYFGLVWLLASVGFVTSAFSILTGQLWWENLIPVASIASLVAIVPWWNTVPTGAWVGALFDVLVLFVFILPAGERLLAMLH